MFHIFLVRFHGLSLIEVKLAGQPAGAFISFGFCQTCAFSLELEGKLQVIQVLVSFVCKFSLHTDYYNFMKDFKFSTIAAKPHFDVLFVWEFFLVMKSEILKSVGNTPVTVKASVSETKLWEKNIDMLETIKRNQARNVSRIQGDKLVQNEAHIWRQNSLKKYSSEP